VMRWDGVLAGVVLTTCAACPGQAPAAFGQRMEDLPPAARLGARVELVRRRIPVIPVVVLASDRWSYVEAIAGWSVTARYPVLYDDGSPEAGEDIGRFVRGFSPRRVVRYSSPAGGPEDAGGVRGRIEDAAARAWGASSAAELGKAWAGIGFTPPGVVAANERDPAWTGALAFAAGRGEPIIWVNGSGEGGGVDGEMSAASCDSLAGALERACDGTGLAWRGLGDAIDAVTLCLAAPSKVRTGADATCAMTDLIGRHGADDGRGRVNGARWAWAGQVFGNESQASYRAMCALFLQPKSAWLFDGYPDSPPWNTWDASRAAEVLGRMGLTTVLDDTPRQGLADWEFRASRPLDAGLVLVNSKGNADYFELSPGQGRPGDTPMLVVPAAVHFVHSWSAAWPTNRDTVAGRWLERGAYAYAGSVQEPFLQAFVPTPAVAARLGSGYPWGAAVRMDQGPAWRITVIGDPLMTVGPEAPRSEAELPLAGVVDAADALPGLLKEKQFATALALLTRLGRDSDAARLGRAMMKDDPASFTPEAAAATVLPLFRAGGADRVSALVEVFERLPPQEADRPGLRDALWLACMPGLSGKRDERLLGVLRANLRSGQVGRDAAALAPALSAVHGRRAASAMLGEARGLARSGPDADAIDAAVRALGGVK
jgi:hypothetical protein